MYIYIHVYTHIYICIYIYKFTQSLERDLSPSSWHDPADLHIEDLLFCFSMHPRIAFAIGAVVGHLVLQTSHPNQLEEVAAAKMVLRGLKDSQGSLEWLCWVQGKLLELNVLVDLIVLVWFVWHSRCRYPSTPLISDTWDSSSDSDESSNGPALALSDRGDSGRLVKGGRKGPTRPSSFKGGKSSWRLHGDADGSIGIIEFCFVGSNGHLADFGS